MRKTTSTILRITAIALILGFAFIAWPGSVTVIAAIASFEATMANKGILAAIRAVLSPLWPLLALAGTKMGTDFLTEVGKKGVVDKLVNWLFPKEKEETTTPAAEEEKEEKSPTPPRTRKVRKTRQIKRVKRR